MTNALYYTLIRNFYSGYYVMKVTCEKHTQVYGSTKEIGSTHCRKSNTMGKFKTEEDAQSKIVAITNIQNKYKPLHEANSREGRRLYQAERSEISELIGNY